MKRFLIGLSVGIGVAFSTSTFVQAKPGALTIAAEVKGMTEKEKAEVRTEREGEKADKNAEMKNENAEKKVNQEKEKAERHVPKAAKKHGLDRADEVAGEHGKQGRENAREKQGR